MHSPILAPVMVLVLWSLVMLFWLAASRLPALRKAGVDIGSVVGGRGQDLEGVLPANVNWKAHNYAHLMEQPTIFYATVIVLTVSGGASMLDVELAWAYVVLRIVHSLVQALWNRIAVRFSIFFISTVVLLALAIDGLRAVL
jgi:hypothetical protein